jgi:hypothetical protein
MSCPSKTVVAIYLFKVEISYAIFVWKHLNNGSVGMSVWQHRRNFFATDVKRRNGSS